MSIDLIIERIKNRMEVLGTDARATSNRAGLSSDAVRRIIQKRRVTYAAL